MNVYLIGMPGCGKSTVGKELEKITNLKLIDLDSYIEDMELLSIPEIFNTKGEAYFRCLEHKALEKLASIGGYIISCGGGIIGNSKNKDLMKGIVIFIDCDIKTLEDRISKDTNNIRPMFKTKTVKELFNERIDKYLSFMDYKVKNESPKSCALKIKEIIGEEK